MKVDANTPRTEITVQGTTFTVPQPYKEGDTLQANEAGALNQLVSENLRNNFASKVKDALDEVGGSVDKLDIAALQAELDSYAVSYEFGVRRGGGFTPKDPVERAALNIARQLVRQALKKKGIDLKTLPEGKLDELAHSVIATRPDITEAAKKQVEATQSVAELTDIPQAA